MAYVGQNTKATLVAAVKSNLKQVLGDDKLKVSFAVRNHSTIVATILSGTIDFGTDNATVNPYWLNKQFDGKSLEVLQAIVTGLKTGHYDRSDLSRDYFDTAWYIDVKIGKWNSPYVKIKG